MFSLLSEMDSGFFTVKFDSLLMKDAVVEADGVIPPLREDDPLSSDPDSDDAGDADAVGYAKGLEMPITCRPNILFKLNLSMFASTFPFLLFFVSSRLCHRIV